METRVSSERVLDVPAARDYLGRISKSTMQSLIRGQQIPVIRIGRRVLLLESDLVKFLRANRRPATRDVAPSPESV